MRTCRSRHHRCGTDRGACRRAAGLAAAGPDAAATCAEGRRHLPRRRHRRVRRNNRHSSHRCRPWHRPHPMRSSPSRRRNPTTIRALRPSARNSPRSRKRRTAPALAKLVLVQGFFWLKEDRQRRRQEDRHRGARDRAQPRGQGRLGLGDARRIRRRRDRRALSGPSQHGVLARRPAVQVRGRWKSSPRRPRPTSATGASPRPRTSRCARPRSAERAGDREARHAVRARDARHGAERQPGLHARRRRRAARSASWRPRRSTRSARTSSATARTRPAPGRSSA